MITKFVYTCKKNKSMTNIYTTDLNTVKELHTEGFIINCRTHTGA